MEALRHHRRRVLFILCTALLVLAPGCATSPNADKPKTPAQISDLYLDIGTSALTNDDLPRAVENLRNAIVHNPENAIAHNHLGLAYLGLGRREEAKTSFERAASIKPNYSDAYVNLGAWHYLKGDNVTAKHYYEKSLENLEYRDRCRPLTNLAQIAYQKNDIQQAKKYLFEALADNKNYCLAHLLLGSIYNREGSPARAQGEFKASIKGTCSNNIDGQYQLGVAYVRLKEYKKARTQFLQIMEQFPNTALAEKASEELRSIP